MKCICSRMAQTNSLSLQEGKPTENLEFNYKSICLLFLVLFPSFHYKCSALAFRTLGCPSLWITVKEKIAMKFGRTRLFCCTPQMFRQTRPRWWGVNWRQKLQGNSTAHRSFNSTEADLKSIILAVQLDPIIMVIERPIVKGEDHSKNPLLGVNNLLLSHALHIEVELEMKLVCLWCFGSW